MGWFRSTHPLAGVNYLDLVPSHAVAAQRDPAGDRVVLLMPRYGDWFFGRLLQPLLRGDKRFIRVPLDPRGSWLWDHADGQRTVGELAEGFRETFAEDADQAEERVSRYIAAMVGHRFMSIRDMRQ
jgi:hypothetical protein